jgi:hypothetical protein
MLELRRPVRLEHAWLLPLLFIAADGTAGCGESCDEDVECSEARFEGCVYNGCGEIECYLDLTVGHVVCNDDGTQGCTAWPESAEGCEALSTPEEQAGCTELLTSVLSATSSANESACRSAVLEIAPCLLQEESAACDFEPLDAACFDVPPVCN